MRVRNGIAIPVKPHVGSLAGGHRAHHLGVEGMGGQRQEARLLLREDLRDGLIAVLGMWELMRNLVAPASKLGVEIVDIGKRPRGKERIAEVLNLSLDFALFVASPGRAGPRRKVIVPGELEQGGVNRMALPWRSSTALRRLS